MRTATRTPRTALAVLLGILLGTLLVLSSGQATTLTGTAKKNTLRGTPRADILRGLAGNDTLYGAAGNDRLFGQQGNDTLWGGVGRDTLSGDAGDDLLNGGAQKDVYRGGPGNDTVNSRDGVAEVVDCGTGSRDVAIADALDTAKKNCETVRALPGGTVGGGEDPAVAREINALVGGLNYDPRQLLSVVEDGATETNVNAQRAPGSNSVIITTYRNVNLRKNLSELVLLRPTGGVVYPGALVLADRDLAAGQPKPLAVTRRPVTISIDLPGLTNSRRTVEVPSGSSVQAAINSLTQQWNDTAYREGYVNTARSILQTENGYSSQQLSLKLGFSAAWASGSAQANLTVTDTSKRSTAMAFYKQIFYTVTMDTPDTPAGVFGNGVTAQSLSKLVDDSRPPAYVRSVDYGRLVMIRMETSEVATSVDVQGALKQVAAGGTKFGVDIDSRYESLVKNATFSVVAIGGGAQYAAEFSGSETALAEMAAYIRNGAVYTKGNPGAPVAYTVAFLKDNGIAKMGFTTDYQQAESVVYPNGFVQLANRSAYVSDFQVDWNEPLDLNAGTWTPRTWPTGSDNGNRSAGSFDQVNIPGDARNLRVRGWAFTGLFWDPKPIVFDQSLEGPNNKCYVVKGGTLTRDWELRSSGC